MAVACMHAEQVADQAVLHANACMMVIVGAWDDSGQACITGCCAHNACGPDALVCMHACMQDTGLNAMFEAVRGGKLESLQATLADLDQLSRRLPVRLLFGTQPLRPGARTSQRIGVSFCCLHWCRMNSSQQLFSGLNAFCIKMTHAGTDMHAASRQLDAAGTATAYG